MNGVPCVPIRPPGTASPRIVVLGGGSPFTAALVDAIADRTWPFGGELVLHGRSREALQLLESYGRLRLGRHGWRVAACDDVERAVEGAWVVVHQVRYGGLEGRRDDEELARLAGCPADETLGPGGLPAGLRAAPMVRELAETLLRAAPDALVLNLTNPLSVVTAVLARSGVRVVGLCELPELTIEKACAVLDVDEREVTWAYSGLNHRGFLHGLERGGRDLLRDLVERLGEAGTIEGITGREIESCGAVPLKYFALFRPHPPRTAGRAEEVLAIRQAVLDELRRDTTRTPPSLARRSTVWYERSVVPALHALSAGEPRRHVVDLPSGEGIVVECVAEISAGGVRACPVGASAPPAASGWLERFERHERAVLGAVDAPSLESVRAALAVDPLTPPDRVDEVARAVWRYAVGDGRSTAPASRS